mgnify:CR=1
MFQIYYIGKYKDESHLIKGQPYPYLATQSKKRQYKWGFFTRIISWFTIILNCGDCWILTFFSSNYGQEWAYHYCLYFSMYPQIIIHEIIYTLVFPINAHKEIWSYIDQGVMFVCCEERLNKSLFIVMCLTPIIVLGILLFLIWYFVALMLTLKVSFCWALMSFAMTISAVGDFVNVFIILFSKYQKAQKYLITVFIVFGFRRIKTNSIKKDLV